jgi:DNA-binding FadR family transcriptional regulator
VRSGTPSAQALAARGRDALKGDRVTLSMRSPDQRRNKKTSERVAADIIKDIIEKSLPPGTRLPPEHEMAEIYNCSRQSLREGLRILEINGLVSLRAGPMGGPIVGSAHPAHFARAMTLFFEMRGTTFKELMLARVTIEPMMARLAAERVAHGDVSDFHELQLSMKAHAELDPRDLNKYFDLCEHYHRTVAGLSGNSILDLFGGGLCEIVREPVRTSAQPATRWTHVRSEHEAVANAIMAGEPAQAEALMTEHMRKFYNSFEKRYGPLIRGKIGWQ